MEAKEPEKKIPSTAAKAIRRSAKEPLLEIHLKAQAAFLVMQGTEKKEVKQVTSAYLNNTYRLIDCPTQGSLLGVIFAKAGRYVVRKCARVHVRQHFPTRI
jgi:hypothetical protein